MSKSKTKSLTFALLDPIRNDQKLGEQVPSGPFTIVTLSYMLSLIVGLSVIVLMLWLNG